jgi:hypothetical protein
MEDDLIMKAERIPARREIQSELIELQRPAMEEIRMRAYEIYLERGDGPGSELEDWLRAEAELQPEMAMAQVA